MASGADRISNLPEGVLHHILSHGVLAHRWRDLWQSAPAVRFAGCRGWPGGIEAFVLFVDGLLRQRRVGTPLDSCEFDLDLEIDPSDLPAVERQGNSFICRALRRQVLELRFGVSVHITPRLPFTLSDRQLASEHLARLELADVKGNASVLDFSGCPSLEELKMVDCQVRSPEIQSPSVKYLRIKYCHFCRHYRTGLSFPNPISFEFITNAGRAPLLESMPMLETAKVRFDHFFDDKCRNGRSDADCGDAACSGCYYYYGPDDYGCVFLEGLIHATHLYLSARPKLTVFNRDLKYCPEFTNLKTLVLCKWFVAAEFCALSWFLHNAPLLEKLTLVPTKVHKKLLTKEESCEPSGHTCASDYLKLVEIICKEVDVVVLKSLKILSLNGIPVEKIRVHCYGRGLSADSILNGISVEKTVFIVLAVPNTKSPRRAAWWTMEVSYQLLHALIIEPRGALFCILLGLGLELSPSMLQTYRPCHREHCLGR